VFLVWPIYILPVGVLDCGHVWGSATLGKAAARAAAYTEWVLAEGEGGRSSPVARTVRSSVSSALDAHCSLLAHAVPCRALPLSACLRRAAQRDHISLLAFAMTCSAVAAPCSPLPCGTARCRSLPACAVHCSATAVCCSPAPCRAARCCCLPACAVPRSATAARCWPVPCRAAHSLPSTRLRHAAQCAAALCPLALCRAAQRQRAARCVARHADLHRHANARPICGPAP
jgi:hypothetical protein